MDKTYYCLICNERMDRKNNNCPMGHQSLIDNPLGMKQTRWGRFLYWFFGVDIIYWMAFLSGVTINGIWMSHSNWSACERIIESLCMGFFLAKVLKNDKS